MNVAIAVFKSREQSMRFSGALVKRGYGACLINTPRELYSGCGISVRFDEPAMSLARQILRQYDFPAFAGFYSFDGRKYIRIS